MTTKREQFTEWLRDFIASLNDSDDAKDYLLTRGERDEIADAAARIWEGDISPAEADKLYDEAPADPMSDTTNEQPGETISPGLVKHYKQAAHQIGDLFTWCVEHMRGMQFGPDSADWIDQIKNRLLTFATLQANCERWSAMYAKQADELVAVKQTLADVRRLLDDERDHVSTFKARLAEVEAERNCLLVTGGSTNPFVVAEAMERLKQRAEAAEGRVKKIQTAWNRVAGFAVSESCGPENRFRITIDYPTLEKLQDAYRAMHDITTAIATTPPADGAQSS